MKAIFRLALTAAFLFSPWMSRADILSELTSEQLAQLKKGDLVVKTRDVKGGVWPELSVYALVKATVKDVTSVFRDYDNAHTYIPNLIEAKVIDKPAPQTLDVRYTVKTPIISKMSYVVRNKYRTDGPAAVVEWNLVESPLAKESTGSLRAEPYEDGTLLRYTNYVLPKTSLAVVAKNAALNEVKSTVTAIKEESENRATKGK